MGHGSFGDRSIENMIKKNVIGKQWFHVFDKNGRVDIPCTEQEYRALAVKDAASPALDGAVWKFSYECYLYDTSSGHLEKNQYADDPENGRMVVHPVNGRITSLERKYIIDNELTAEGLSQYIKQVF